MKAPVEKIGNQTWKSVIEPEGKQVEMLSPRSLLLSSRAPPIYSRFRDPCPLYLFFF